MPLVLSSKPTFNYLVKVSRPGDTGKIEKFEFMGEFKRLSQPEIDTLVKEAPGDAVVIERVFTGWRAADIKTPEGADLEVNDSNRTALLAEPGVPQAIARAYFDAVVFGPSKN